MLKSLPNLITYLRVLASPLLAVLLVLGAYKNPEFVGLPKIAFWIFVIAASTDWVDGFLARLLNAKSELGAKLDLLADKLLVGLTIPAIVLAEFIRGTAPFALLVFIGLFLTYATSGRDYLVTIWREEGKQFGLSMPATFLAKSKTALILIGISIFLAFEAFGLKWARYIGFTIVVIGAILSIYTGYQYFRAFHSAKTKNG